MRKKSVNATAAYERAVQKTGREHYVLHLYISGTTPQSQKALWHIRKVCEEHLKDRVTLQVIDIYQNPALAKKEHVIAVPTLIKLKPSPLKRLIGDLSNEDRVLHGLGIVVKRR